MRKFIATLMVAGAIFVAAPTVAQAAQPTHVATCVNTSFFGRAFSFFFLPTSYTAYLWRVKC
jgi:hypothetical protein